MLVSMVTICTQQYNCCRIQSYTTAYNVVSGNPVIHPAPCGIDWFIYTMACHATMIAKHKDQEIGI